MILRFRIRTNPVIRISNANIVALTFLFVITPKSITVNRALPSFVICRWLSFFDPISYTQTANVLPVIFFQIDFVLSGKLRNIFYLHWQLEVSFKIWKIFIIILFLLICQFVLILFFRQSTTQHLQKAIIS